MGSGATAVNLESESCSENGDNCFSRFSGMGMVHQQFLRVLGMVGEHQRPDSSYFMQAQTSNLNILNDEISERFLPIAENDWEEHGSGFDFTSVTMFSFYDFNSRSLDELMVSWDESQYSIVSTECGVI